MRAIRPRTQPTGLLGPDSIELHPRRIRVGDVWCESFAVTGYPREVRPGWLSPLLNFPGRLDLALHVEPVPNDVAAGQLRRQIARLESSRRLEVSNERLVDPELRAAARDAMELAAGLAEGEGRLFRVGLYLTVRAGSPDALDQEVRRVRAVASSLLLDMRPLTFRAVEGWTATLPLGLDPVRLRRTFDTKALASCFPFGGAEIGSEGGVLVGKNASTGGLVFFDRFGQENFNQVILARSGAGKSYLAKLMALRSLYLGIEVLVVDPENEYERLAAAVGGSVIKIGGGSRLNPFDLSNHGEADALLNQALFVHTVVGSLIGDLTAEEKAILDSGILRAYEHKGITADPNTHSNPAPLLSDLGAALDETAEGSSLARRLEPFFKGSHREIFDGPTTIRPDGQLVVFSLRGLPEELKPVGTLLALNSIWKKVIAAERRRRIVVVDEAWWLVRSSGVSGLAFLNRLAKSARKHWCGLITVTQDAVDLLSTDLGQAVVTNASSHFLLGQSPQAIEPLSKAFELSEGEVSYLLSCDRGQGLLSVGLERAPVRVIASKSEDIAITTDPAALAEMDGSR